jgi:hypothetical protein
VPEGFEGGNMAETRSLKHKKTCGSELAREGVMSVDIYVS